MTHTSQSCPIFFYTGNEGDIWTFYRNTGWMTGPLAKNFSALVVFAEHRYYGESFPGDKATAFQDGNGKHLTVEQTLLDYVMLLKKIKADYNAEDKAVIAFGGSYGGMLAAWMRMKYPMHVQGAIAASAPVMAFKDSTTCDQYTFDDTVSQVWFDIDGGKCKNWIRATFDMMKENRDEQ
jgi:pimeloyl-ACP methyl ester carboxylesterase